MYEAGKRDIKSLYEKYLIQLSQMVEDNRLSSTSAKIVFETLREDHQSRLQNWDNVCKLVAE